MIMDTKLAAYATGSYHGVHVKIDSLYLVIIVAYLYRKVKWVMGIISENKATLTMEKL